MPASKRRRWFSLSLRTVLIGMMVISVGFGWFLHHRRELFREKERIAGLFGDYPVQSDASEILVYREGASNPFQLMAKFQFCDSILGWDLPEDTSRLSEAFGGGPDRWSLLRVAAGPRLRSATLYQHYSEDPPAFPSVARGAKHVVLAHTPLTTSLIEQCLSDQTESLYIGRVAYYAPDVPPDALTVLARAPNLKRLTAPGDLSASSWRTVFSHPSLEELETSGDVARLGTLPAIGKSNHLHRMQLQLHSSESDNKEAEHEFAWLSDCTCLTRLEIINCRSPWFLLKASQQCPEVRELLADHRLSPNDFTALRNWKELRRLEIGTITDDVDAVIIDDDALAGIVDNSPGLESLLLGSGSHLTTAGLRPLQRLSGLTRLELYCAISKEHLTEVAKLPALEDLLIADPEVDDDAAQPLTSLPRLKRICLEYTAVSPEAFAARRVSVDEF